MYLLELAKIPANRNDQNDVEEVLKKMVQMEEVWFFLLPILKPTSKLHSLAKVKVVVSALKSFRALIVEHSIRVGYLLQIQEAEATTLGKFCSLIDASEGKLPQQCRSESTWKNEIWSDCQKALKFQETFSKMEHSIQFVQTVVGGVAEIEDVAELSKEINKRKKFSNKSLNEVLDGSYWGSLLFPLIESAEVLDNLQQSTFFFNIACSLLKTENGGMARNAEFGSADQVMQLLSSKGIERLQKACNPLFDRKSDPAIEDVHMLLYGITDADDLHKELQFISKYFRRSGVTMAKEHMLVNYLKYPLVQEKAKQLVSTLEVFGYTNANCPMIKNSLEEFVTPLHLKPMTLKSLCESLETETMAMVDSSLDKDLTNVVSVLSESRELLSFVEETVREDMVVLIDVVEEHSDQFVSEATVSHLIDVHRFLKNIVKDKPAEPMAFLHLLKSCYDSLQGKQGMAAKIDECSRNVHSLRALYMNVANRGEMTKEIISNALKRGRYQLGRNDDGSWEVLLTYERQKNSGQSEGGDGGRPGPKKSDPHTCYRLTDLQDLRSRALLVVNIDSKHHSGKAHGDGHTKCSAADLNEFVKQVDQIMEILSVAAVLHNTGHPDYKAFWVKLSSADEIEEKARTMAQNITQWKDILEAMQKKYFCLNYFHPDQLWILRDFFARMPAFGGEEISKKSVVHDLLRFIEPSLSIDALDTLSCLYQNPKRKTLEGDLCAIGEALDAFFLPLAEPPFYKVLQHRLQGAVQPGELFVAVLEQGSPQTVHVVMSLFELTTGTHPAPNQVLFCHQDTSWEEIQRLLRRSFEAQRHQKVPTLHCLANVESLPNDMQFDLVAGIKDLQSISNDPYLLSLVCRGGPHHHIVDQFASGARNVTGMTEVKLKAKFKETLPDVSVVTSDLPGMGKTETIFSEAIQKEKAVVTFPISGPLSRSNLVHRLASLQMRECDCIHLDIGEVDNPLALDTFLFELVVMGMVSSGTQIYHLPTKQVYIEIANTLNDWLQDSLPVTKCFTSIHVKFEGYKHYVVSLESSSPIQVVCNYLHAHQSGTLESKELIFSGPNKVKPLSCERCKTLLRKYFCAVEISYNIVENFLGVFADQLLKFSASPFLKPSNLKAMLGQSHDVRTRLFEALLKVSREFAVRSVVTCKSVQSEAISDQQATEVLKQAQFSSVKTANKMIERVDGMIQWADNNHLLLIFQRALTISVLYRKLLLVPPSVQTLYKIQEGKELEDYANFNQGKLQQKLELLARATETTEPASHVDPSLKYALTPDNILKMVLILLRIRANVPVIIMGETGCGKTSLVRYLAKTCDVPLCVFNFHAGVTETHIINFVEGIKKEALSPERRKQPMWVFLDEINTCDYLGTINEIMCHRTITGKPLPSNLVFIAACNPYRLRPVGKILTSGLSEKTSTDEYSRLVYRVHPLPETMIDYVWDYGTVSPDDERRYIARMVEGVFDNKHGNLLVEVLFSSQRLIREFEHTPFCVSLRDVHRCIVLMNWFHRILQEREKLAPAKIPTHIQKDYYEQTRSVSLEVRSVVLALAHCYQSRLQTAKKRREFCREISNLIGKAEQCFGAKHFDAIVRVEQEEYLARMELPEGTAKNAALRENVFVILVCILNRIPVFVVGKPGCSKSLSMQVIRSNLRGKDSKDPFLKQLPQLYVVSYQGSESSTSDGILKVFEKARRYNVEGANDVLPVVLLDEIGLAEVSAFNPLKVLHSLLEPGDGQLPDVAVVGISNWCLDPAKMNRAIHLSRPEPDIQDLFQTGQSIREAQLKQGNPVMGTSPGYIHAPSSYPDDYQLHCLAKAYQEYQKAQTHDNFHGLRDYYSLVKSLSSSSCDKYIAHHQVDRKTTRTQRALQRNFGGLPFELNKIQQLFLGHFQSERVLEDTQSFPVTDLICDNLHDKFARHMMIITNGDSAIGILDQTLRSLEKEKVTIFGSRFEEDQSEEYNYNILSRIILCMERNCVLILRDLESIYGSLYDMLNQNYTVVGQKKNCRVALGPFSNPMCQVDDGFRCIVLIDEQRVDYTDPPFLNRFEKQLLRFSDVLNDDEKDVISCLRDWTKAISTVQERESHFNETDMFLGFNEDTLPSLVLHLNKDKSIKKHTLTELCKEELMSIATPDGVLRSLRSDLSTKTMDEVQSLFTNYFSKPLHSGLREYLRQVLEDLQTRSEDQIDTSRGMKLLIMTHSNIHTNVSRFLTGLGNCQAEKLSAFKSEKQLAKQLQSFWISNANMLVLQCKPDLDAPHMLVAKHLIEDQRNTYISSKSGNAEQPTKHVCIIVHVQRASKCKAVESPQWQFSFLSGWKQVAIDTLEEPIMPIMSLLEENVTDLLDTESFSFERIASDQLLWCFTRIKYSPAQQPTLDAVLHLVKQLKSSPAVMKSFKKIVVNLLRKDESGKSHDSLQSLSWLMIVASDRLALVNSSTLVGTIEHHFNHLIQQPLAKIVYFLEKESAWPKEMSSFEPTSDDRLHVWTELLLDEAIFCIEDIPESQGAESYFMSGHRHELEFPFSSVFAKKVDKIKSLFIDDVRRLQLEDANLDGNGELEADVFEAQLRRFVPEIKRAIQQVYDNDEHLQSNAQCYVNDLLDLKTAYFAGVLRRDDRIDLLKSVVSEHIRVPASGDFALLITQLHCAFWMKEAFFLSALHLSVKCRDIVPVDVKTLTSPFLLTFNKMMFEKQYSTMVETNPSGSPELFAGSEEETIGDVEGEGPKMEIQSVVNDIGEEESEDECKDIDENDIPPTFVELLVESFCAALFPTADLVKRFQDPSHWQRSVSLLLSMVSRMQLSVPAFHFLRLCHDFVSLVLSQTPIKPCGLYRMGEIGHMYASEGYLDSQDCFELIEQLVDSFEDKDKDLNNLKEFRVLFYARCIDSNPDTPLRGLILSRISCSGDTTLVKLAGPVVHQIFCVENHCFPGIFEELLHDLSLMENHPGLQDMCHALSSLTGDVELDCPFVVMCCDLILDVGFPVIDLATTSGSSDKCIANLRRAAEIVSRPCKGGETDAFSLVCATAYLRSFLSSFARLTVQKPSILASDTEFSMLVREVNPVLLSNENRLASVRTSQTRLFFLRVLRKDLPLHAIKHIVLGSKKLPALKALEWHAEDQTLVGKLSFDPFMALTEKTTAKGALASLIHEKNEKPLRGLLISSQQSPTHKIELAAVLTKWFYLVRSIRNLGDSEEKAIDFVHEEISNFPQPYAALLQRVTGKKDFQVRELCLSPESSPRDVHRAALILHLCILLTSHYTGTKSEFQAFLSYLVKPRRSRDTFIVASANSPQYPFEKHRNSSSFSADTVFFSCSCGTLSSSKHPGDSATCPECKTSCIVQVEQKEDEGRNKACSPVKGYILLPPSDDVFCCVRSLGPSNFRIIHLLVHGALYGGLALGIVHADSFAENMVKKDQGNSFADVCFQHIVSDLSALRQLFNCEEEEVILLLHRVLEVTAPILTTVDHCTSEIMRISVEQKISDVIGPLVREFCVKRKIFIPNVADSLSQIERQIEECDNLQFADTSERKLHIPRLFRVTSSKSLNSLRAYYMHAGSEIKAAHPLLGLFLDFQDRLPMVSHLNTLLIWTRIVENQLSRRISRQEASRLRIGEIIRGEHHSKKITDDEKEWLGNAFKKFKSSWEKIRPAVMEAVGTEVPHMTEVSPISLCLVERRDNGKFLFTALSVLQEIQNEFVQKALDIAASGKCAALRFLEREGDSAVVQMVHLQDAQEKEIIQYQWSSDILKHSQHNTDYGQGREILYDIGRIEKELAISFLLGKSYLSSAGGLREFMFAKELFHACKGILNDLETIVPQQPLTQDIQAGLQRLKERSLKGVQDLLEHMEIVLCLLKKHEFGEPSEPLIEFTDRWLADSRPFPTFLLPEPRKAALLMHVVSLYEFLEDLLADSATEGIHDMYREELPSDTREQMSISIENNSTVGSDHIPLGPITIALRRFIFRYISAEDTRPEPGLSLLEHMVERSLWPMEITIERKEFSNEQWKEAIKSVFPEVLTLGHIHAVLGLYQNQIKVSSFFFAK